jgi:hypothetical protein
MRYLRNTILVAAFVALPPLALAQEPANAGATEMEPAPLPAPSGKGPGMGRSYQQYTPGPGRGSPGYQQRGQRPLLEDFPVYGPPPGLGRAYPRERVRGGPGYPGLRGPGTGYRQHRQYGNPPRYPIQPPRQQDLGEAGPDANAAEPGGPPRIEEP